MDRERGARIKLAASATGGRVGRERWVEEGCSGSGEGPDDDVMMTMKIVIGR